MTLRILALAILTFAITALSFPLDSVLARGDSCLNVEWTPDSINTKPDWYIAWGADCTGRDTVYRHCDFKPGVTYRSICYSYGGEDPYDTFRDKVSRGFLVGSHLCHYSSFGDPTPVIAGSDCSGFVCYIWNVPRVATGTLASKYPAILKSELEPGDILVKSGSHTVLIVEAIDPTHFLIWEETSAVNGCRERTIDITAAEWSSYVARRNTAVVPLSNRSRKVGESRIFHRITVRNGGKTVFLRLAKTFTGILEIRDAAGKTVCRKTITEAGTAEYPLEKPLACGTYIAALRNNSGNAEATAVFMVTR